MISNSLEMKVWCLIHYNNQNSTKSHQKHVGYKKDPFLSFISFPGTLPHCTPNSVYTGSVILIAGVEYMLGTRAEKYA